MVTRFGIKILRLRSCKVNEFYNFMTWAFGGFNCDISFNYLKYAIEYYR